MSPQELTQLFQNFDKLKILIIGDVMLDSYLWGKVDRISPESPVPIVSVHNKEMRLGGAANVAMNVKSLGATPILFTVIGEDDAGKELCSLMTKLQMPVYGLLQSKDRKTTSKTRIISGSHHHLRVDEEVTHDLPLEETKNLIAKIINSIETEKINAIIFEDYDKGIITQELISQIVKNANQHSIPTIVDPKKKNFHHYKNVTLFKPNLKELKEGIKNDLDSLLVEQLNGVVTSFLQLQNIKAALVTLSEKGVYVNYNGLKQIFPAHVRNVADVSGAGDTVVSIAALCEACQIAPHYMAMLCNLAGGIVCEEAGVVPIDKERLLKEAIEEIKNVECRM